MKKEMNEQEIYNYLQDKLSYIFDEYKFIFSSKEEFKKLINDYLKNMNHELSTNIKTCEQKIKEYLYEFLKENIQREPNKFIVYLNTLLDKITITDNSFKNFKAVIKIIKNYEDYFTPEIYIELLNKSNRLNDIIKKIIEENYSLVQNNKLEQIVNSDIAVNLLEIYCGIHNIEINKESIENDNYDITIDDAFSSYVRNIPSKLLTIEEEIQFFERIRQGDKRAKKKLIEHNLKLVISIAKKYMGKGLEFLDLIQEGNLGLIKAVDRFDYEKGFKFSTYATWWIRQAIDRAVKNKGRLVRIPVHMYDNNTKYHKAVEKLNNELGREPTQKEIAEYLDISIEEVAEMYRTFSQPVSLNECVGDEENTELGNFVPDPSVSLEDSTISSLLSKEIRTLFEKVKLTPKEIQILDLRYGLSSGETKTLEEVGEIYGITRERIRQIEERAKDKLLRSPYIKEFSVYMSSPTSSLDALKKRRKESKEKGNKKKVYQEKVRERKRLASGAVISRKFKNLYQSLNIYTEEEIDTAITFLSNDEKELLIKAYGLDLHQPVRSKEWDNNDSENLYENIIPKLKHLIKEIRKFRTSKPFPSIFIQFKKYPRKLIDMVISNLTAEERILFDKAYGSNLEEPVRSEELTLSDYLEFQTNLLIKIKSNLDKLVLELGPDKVKSGRGRKKGKIKSLCEYFDGYSKEQIARTIEELSDEEKQIIYLGYGPDLEKPVRNESFNQSMSIKLYGSIIPKMRTILLKINQSTMIPTIYQLLKKYPKEQIDKIIESLTQEEKELVYLVYGSDLENPVKNEVCDEKTIEQFYNCLIPKLHDLLSVKKEEEKKKMRKFKTIYELLSEYSKEQINEVIDGLPQEDKALLYDAYGSDLENPVRGDNWTRKQNYELNSLLIARMRTKLKNIGKKGKTIYDLLSDYPKEKVNEVLNNLTDEEKKLLKLIYGEGAEINGIEFEKIQKRQDLSEEEKTIFRHRLLPKIRKALKGEKTSRIVSFYKHFKFYTKEEVDKIIGELTEDEKLLIRKGYGSDLAHPVRSIYWTNDDSIALDDIMQKIRDKFKENLRKYYKIYEFLSDFPKEKVDEEIKKLNEEEKGLLTKAYGKDLENPTRSEDFTQEDYYALKRIVYKLKNILSGKTPRKGGRKLRILYDILGDYSKEEVHLVIDSLNEKDKLLLLRSYGEDLANPVRVQDWTIEESKRLSTNLLPRMRKKLKDLREKNQSTVDAPNPLSEESSVEGIPVQADNEVEVIPEESSIVDEEETTKMMSNTTLEKENSSAEEYVKILSLLKSLSVKEILTSLDEETAVIVMLKVGYIRGNYYSTEAISNFLNIPKEEVEQKFLQGLDIYKNYFNNLINRAIEATEKKKVLF